MVSPFWLKWLHFPLLKSISRYMGQGRFPIWKYGVPNNLFWYAYFLEGNCWYDDVIYWDIYKLKFQCLPFLYLSSSRSIMVFEGGPCLIYIHIRRDGDEKSLFHSRILFFFLWSIFVQNGNYGFSTESRDLIESCGLNPASRKAKIIL